MNNTLFSMGLLVLASGAANVGPVVVKGNPAPSERVRFADLTRESADGGEETVFHIFVFWEIARVGRYGDIAALYDTRNGLMGNLDQHLDFNRNNRVEFAGVIGLALAKSSRKSDAARLFAAADEAGALMLANGQVRPQSPVAIAANDAAMGRHDKAIGELRQAFAKGWRMYDMINGEIGKNPVFASLKGDPRFKRSRAISIAHRAKERREVAALGSV